MKDEQQKTCRDMHMLYEKLIRYGQSDFYPYHMPGHKRNCCAGALSGFSDFFQLDITEIDGFDNLHHAEGILKEAQERAANLYGSEETFFLINGSTCGILSAVCAATNKGDTLLIARNCHKSVYHAAFLQELHLRYLYPGQVAEYGIADAVSPAAVEDALENYPECKAVVITSPTYEGIISDIREIGRIVHAKNKILIVDEAHGAHFGLAEGVPENAVRLGADIVIHSLHKTLPSMTQTALLHVNGSYVNRMKLRKYLSIYQSSSPSYVMMASIDACIAYVRENAAIRFRKFEDCYTHFMECMQKCRHIQIGSPEMIDKERYQFTAWDRGKLVISIKSLQSIKGTQINGQWLYDILRENFHLQMEMAAENYVLAMMTIADEEEGWKRLADALLQIDDRIEMEIKAVAEEDDAWGMDIEARDKTYCRQFIQPAVNMTIGEALAHEGREMPLAQAEGETAGDFVNLYPPGIPLLAPGEVIGADVIAQIREYQRMGLPVQGVTKADTIIIC